MKTSIQIYAKPFVTALFALSVAFTCRGEIVASWTNPLHWDPYPNIYTASSTYVWGQTFTPTASGMLDAITVHVTGDVSGDHLHPKPPSVTFHFYEVQGGSVLTPAIASETVTTQDIPLGYPFGWVSASFAPDGLPLNAGQQYAFSMSYDTSNNQMLYFGCGWYVGHYEAGSLLYSPDNGVTFFNHDNDDMEFVVTTVPEPSVTALFGLGALWTVGSILPGR